MLVLWVRAFLDRGLGPRRLWSLRCCFACVLRVFCECDCDRECECEVNANANSNANADANANANANANASGVSPS